jgi:hypothetical protein
LFSLIVWVPQSTRYKREKLIYNFYKKKPLFQPFHGLVTLDIMAFKGKHNPLWPSFFSLISLSLDVLLCLETCTSIGSSTIVSFGFYYCNSYIFTTSIVACRLKWCPSHFNYNLGYCSYCHSSFTFCLFLLSSQIKKSVWAIKAKKNKLYYYRCVVCRM